MLTPGNISTCGELGASGEYILTNDLATSGSSTCFYISSNDVTINGNGHTITGAGTSSGDIAIDTRARTMGPDSAIEAMSDDYINLVLTNLTIIGFTVNIQRKYPNIEVAEQDTDTGKLVIISSPNENPDAPLVDILASTTIPEIYKVGEESKIQIKWKNENNQEVSFHAYDTDNNGYLDYIEWTVPHLSTQLFEIIFISKAFQLDQDKNIIADVYDSVKTQDGNYAPFTDGQYARVTFAKALTKINDITLFARPTNYPLQTINPTIEVYPVYTDADGNKTEGPLTAVFSNMDYDGTYKILLTNLALPTDQFDLKINGEIDLDYIVDPAVTYYWVGGTTNSNTSNPANWKVGSAGACADNANLNVPISTDIIYFSSNCVNNATVNTVLSAASITLNAGYTGTLTTNASLSVNSFSMYAGTTTINATNFNVATTLIVDSGTLYITNGGTVTAPSGSSGFVIGNSATGNGTVTVTGASSTLTQTIIGDTRLRLGNTTGSIGNLNILNGAVVRTAKTYAAYAAGSTANIKVDGAGTVWNPDIADIAYLGRSGTANLSISNGAVVNTVANPLQIGGNTGSSGTVDITGSGSQLNAGSTICGYSGAGSISVSNGGSFIAVGSLKAGVGAGVPCTLNIGKGTSSGSFLVSDIANGSTNLGQRTINFNHSDSSYNFYTNILNDGFSINQIGTGTTTLTGNNTYTGTTTISAGTLVAGTSTAFGSSSLVVSANGTLGTQSGSLNILGNLTVLASTTFNMIGKNLTVFGNFLNSGTVTNDTTTPITVIGNTTNNGIINNGFTFNSFSTNPGTVNGNAIFSTSSTNFGTVNGVAKFNSLTAIDGTVSFSGTSFNGTGYVNGNILDSFNSQITSWIFNNNASFSNNRYLKGNAIFNNSINYGTILGDATLNGTSSNAGTITQNAYVYYPAARPVVGVSGQIFYRGYPAMYFNDKNTGDGNWSNPLNWWLNASSSVPANSIPYPSDDVYVYSNLATTTISASANNITFENNTTNGISISVAVGAVFNSHSSNLLGGNIIGTTTFMGNYTENQGSVNGAIIRSFNIATSTGGRNFTTANWVIVAQGVILDIRDAIYNLAINAFKALNGGGFNTGGNAVTPAVVSNSPYDSEIITKWLPSVNWGVSTLCEYSYDNWATSKLSNCTLSGSDIARPGAGIQTLSLRGTRFINGKVEGDVTEKNINFTYNNVLPIWTACGTDLLDEPTREYYYLQNGSVRGDCHISANGIKLHGSIQGTGILTGQVISDATSTDGFDITLQDIIVTATTTSGSTGAGKNGGKIYVYNSTTNALVSNGTVGTIGGNAGEIIVSTSTTGYIFANGANGSTNGGAGGSVNVTNSYAIPTDSSITANGGSSTGCGDGGNAGNITSINSSYGILTNDPGTGSNVTCKSQTHVSGSLVRPTVVGIYISPVRSSPLSSINNASVGGGGTLINITNLIGKLNLKNLPSVGFEGIGKNLGTSRLVNPLADLLQLQPITGLKPLHVINWTGKFDKFITSANTLPKSLAVLSNTITSIRKELNKAGIINGYDLYRLSENSPVKTPTLMEIINNGIVQPKNLLFVSVDGLETETRLSIDRRGSAYQILTVRPNAVINVNVKADKTNALPKTIFDNNPILASRDKNNNITITLNTPRELGAKVLTVGDLILEIRVRATAPDPASSIMSATSQGKNLSPIIKLWSWFAK